MWTTMIVGVFALGFSHALGTPTKVPTVTLTQGVLEPVEMPAMGLGTFGYGKCGPTGDGPCSGGEVWNNSMIGPVVKNFIRNGGRRLDGAYSYLTQVGMGKAVRELIEEGVVTREELFITSKTSLRMSGKDPIPERLKNDTGMGYTLWQVQRILENLNTTYIDLMLIHWPGDPRVAPENTTQACAEGHPQANGHKGFSLCRQNAWAALNKLLEDKVVRAIGVSNFEPNHLEDAMTGRKPAVNQNEFHPYFRETALVERCKTLGIHYQSYSPLGASDHMLNTTKWAISPMDQPAVLAVAQTHGISPAQAILKWAWQAFGVSANPRTNKVEHMVENLEALDASKPPLTPAEVDAITAVAGNIGQGAPPEMCTPLWQCANKVCPNPAAIP
eukprot:m.1637541 g.1637541  ORF g.1637541 m.1637541 type:complete len:387 (-) comp25938_c0_seq1:1025-2185(-)